MDSVTAHQSERKKLTGLQHVVIVLGALSLALLLYQSLTTHPSADHGRHGPTEHLPGLWAVIPFAALLLSIAVLPLIPVTSHWWEHNQNRLAVSLILAGVTLLYYLLSYGVEKAVNVLDHAIVAEYIPFMVLLFSLYVISGGIALRGDLAAHPTTNTAFLGFGALIASLVGTTGASMLLIRPLLQTNAERKHVTHTVVFFIFLVSNIGGCLLPIGDPPLFLGYLKGVPFLWTLNLWIEWAFMCAIVLLVYFIWDSVAYKKEAVRDIVRDETQIKPLTVLGKVNLLLLLGVVFCVALVKPGEELLGLGLTAFPFLRELLMLGLVAISLLVTQKGIRASNNFNYAAILEVAALFVGIFICMQAPIEILRASGSALAPYLSSPARFFWATGVLSSFLDNAPTYVVFLETAAAMTPDNAPGVLRFVDGTTIFPSYLTAISLGAVFMGANTYIGNGPNFMVKSIAEQSGVKMPSFFGYMLYSGGILIPLFFAVTWVFL